MCLQETSWKGRKTRGFGARFKLYCHGMDRKRNEVGLILKEEYANNVVEVKRMSNRLMSVKLDIERVMTNVVSG